MGYPYPNYAYVLFGGPNLDAADSDGSMGS